MRVSTVKVAATISMSTGTENNVMWDNTMIMYLFYKIKYVTIKVSRSQ